MINLIITFRETLEAALIVGIIYAYMGKTNNLYLKKHVNAGIILGILFSLVGAIVFKSLLGSFEGKSEEIFEGITMIIGAILIATVIAWMSSKKKYLR